MFAVLYIPYATRFLHVPPRLLVAVLGAGTLGSLLGLGHALRLSRRIGVGPRP